MLSAVLLQLLSVTPCPSPGALSPGPHGTSGSLLAVEWSCSPTFSPLLGEAVIDKLKDLHFTIQGLVSVSTGGAHSRQGSTGRAHSWENPQAIVGMGSGTGTG